MSRRPVRDRRVRITLPAMSASEALCVAEFLDRLGARIWSVYGLEMNELLFDRAIAKGRLPEPEHTDSDDDDLPF